MIEKSFVIHKMEKSEQSVKMIAEFIKENEYLLPDPYSQKIDILQYSSKLNTLGECWYIEKDNKMVGFIGGYINDLKLKRAFLQLILISKKYQNIHGGELLINSFVKYSQEHGFKDIQLTVDLCNSKALHFYNKLGFEKSKEEHQNKTKQYMILNIEEKTITKVQKRLSEMGIIIAGILEKYDIPYMITFGTLLGAVRHNGFIPWDDDFDFFLFDDIYDSAIEILRKELPHDLFVEDNKSEPLFFHGWAHVKDLNTEVFCEQFPQDNSYSHHGLSVDLYRCKRMKMSELCDYRKKEAKAYLERKLKHNFISELDFLARLEKIYEQIDVEEKNTIDSNIDILAMAVKERYMKCEDVFPLKKYKFGDYSFLGPKNPEAILTHFYGDFMSLPKEKDRIPHYSTIKFLN